ncbi:hypothetical protein GCM10010251_95570 [Streptomyces aurantiogriseus]|uniref:Uncharacterized protein n=1 Tax=Streptomyces aurantiogriseus TaxID=66870 RepID=A0A918FPA2_9ACTN|nr:hypothetical protein GCM10010251_95570 [Streptomyces aurantiogriseus]
MCGRGLGVGGLERIRDRVRRVELFVEGRRAVSAVAVPGSVGDLVGSLADGMRDALALQGAVHRSLFSVAVRVAVL